MNLKLRRYTLLLLFIFCGYYSSSGQSYAFAKTLAPYAELDTADYVIPDTSPYFGNITIKVDFNFRAFNTTYDFLNDGAYTVIKGGYFFGINNTRSTTVYLFDADLDARPGPGQESEFSYHLSGTSGNKILKFQWKNMGFEFGDSSDFINFQVWLYETSGKIEVHFGPGSVKPAAYDGATGPVIGLLEMDPAFSTIFEEMYLISNPKNPTMTGNFAELNGTPSDSTVYTFTESFGVSAGKTINKQHFTAYFSETGLMVNTGPAGNSEMHLLTIDGREIISGKLREGANEIEIPELPAGIYVLTVINGNSVSAVKLFR